MVVVAGRFPPAGSISGDSALTDCSSSSWFVLVAAEVDTYIW